MPTSLWFTMSLTTSGGSMKKRGLSGSMESAHRLSTSTPSWATWDSWERCVGIRKTMGSDVVEQRFG
ncbi:hypothetical protein L596_015766 [Steinernema carpocapsae]|uniref:Uncharacterized protein n=1 Tax=Steinernema carpocapsae TaxID=34508 RepID=A0A4U5NG07_STECR|nr:hypothetical protein L596_015757 [Steinernema carpocapsae]TKR81977.1 hypothetical protein L596_015766 [Steinernema carpocapsae]